MLKKLALELNKCVLVVGHTSKEGEKVGTKLSSLSFAGSYRLASNSDSIMHVSRSNSLIKTTGIKSKHGIQAFSEIYCYKWETKNFKIIQNIHSDLISSEMAYFNSEFNKIKNACELPARKHRSTGRPKGRPNEGKATMKIRCSLCKNIKPFLIRKLKEHLKSKTHKRNLLKIRIE